MKEYTPGSKSALIQSALRERYPNGVAETGSWTQLANEFGATRELVRQVAASLGIKRRNRVRMVRVCSSCGKCRTSSSVSGLFCSDCVKIPLACEECGKLRYEYIDWVLRRYDDEYNAKRRAAGLPSYTTGKTFCSKQCSWSYRGKHYGWGSPSHPRNAHKGEHGRASQYQQGCRCDACREASSTYYKDYYARKKAERAAARA